MAFRIAIDGGGTFTDGVLLKENGEAILTKSHSVPSDPAMGTINCIKKLAGLVGMTFEELLAETSLLLNGTTIATNVVAERKGAKIGTIANYGYKHRMAFPQIAKADWAEMPRDTYDYRYDAPKALTENYLMTEVKERLDCKGEVFMELDEEDARKQIRYLKEQGVEAIAVNFMFSPLNPAHERRVGELIKEEFPEAYVALSSSVLPAIGEVERFSTTMFTAYVGPTVSRYVDRMNEELEKGGFKGQMLFVQNNGGMATGEIIKESPATMMMSGPASGPSMARTLGLLHDSNNMLSGDMGGTSFDVGLVHEGIVDTVETRYIDAKKFSLPSVDINIAGAGGGSIAWIDPNGRLRVGPQSAGAYPGPACYGNGGTEPTVTDANVVLGYLDPNYFLGGENKLDKELSKQAIKKVADPLGMTIEECAAAIYTIVSANMANATDVIFARRGYDPREFTMVAAGGACAVHAYEIMREIGMNKLIVPKVAPTYCAYGMMFNDLMHEFQLPYISETKSINYDKLNALFDALEEKARFVLRREGVKEEDMIIEKTIDMRYYGQFREKTAKVPVCDSIDEAIMEQVIANFNEEHEKTLGYADPGFPTEMMRIHLRGIARLHKPQPKALEERENPETLAYAKKGTRNAYVAGEGFKDIDVWDGNKLLKGDRIEGPCIIEEDLTTFVLPKDGVAVVDQMGNYFTTPKEV